MQNVQFIRNLTANRQTDQKFKILIEKIFKDQVKQVMDQYSNLWKKYFANWKKNLHLQFKALINTFDSKVVEKFIQNLQEKQGQQDKQDQLNFLANSMKIAGNNHFVQIDAIVNSMLKAYKKIHSIFKEEISNLQARNKFIQSSLHKKRLQKLVPEDPKNRFNGIIHEVIEGSDDEGSQQNKNKQQNNSSYQKQQNGVKNQAAAIARWGQQKKQIIQLQIDLKNYKSIFPMIEDKSIVRKIIIKFQHKDSIPDTLMNLGLCYNLQQLQVQQPLLATKQMILFIISTFTKLQRLSFNCFNKFDQQCAQIILQKLPNLQTCYWGCNFYKSIGKIADLRAFREHPREKRKESINNQCLIEMIKGLSNLQNIWISDVQSVSFNQLLPELKTLPFLKHLSIGKYSKQQTSLHPSHFQQISSLTNLHSLAFIKIKLSDSKLFQILQKNKQTLRTLVIYDCSGLTDQIWKWIKQKQFKQLKQLYLYRLGGRLFKGEYVWDLVQLDTIVVRMCEFYPDYAQDKIGKMKNLIYLDLHGCPWVSDLVVSNIPRQVFYLNLGYSNITYHSGEPIMRLKNLQILHVGGTNVNQLTVQKICRQKTNLKKLSLSTLSGSTVNIGRGVMTKGKLLELGKIIKNCTHLDVSACDRIDDSALDNFHKLMFINLWSTKVSEKVKNSYRQKGMVVIDSV